MSAHMDGLGPISLTACLRRGLLFSALMAWEAIWVQKGV